VLGQPALADAGNRGHGLSPEELAFVFGDPNADGFEVLSPEELAKIDGEYGWVTVRRFISYMHTFGRRLASYRVRFGNHPPHHGWQRHLEIVIYRRGVKGSDRKFIYDYDQQKWKHLPPDRPR